MIPPGLAGKGGLVVVAELVVFADESGVQGGASYCLLAGYIGSVRQWLLFEDDWRKVLAEFEVPEFHAKRFFGRDNQRRRLKPYRDWSRQKATLFIDRLMDTVAHRRLTPVGGGVDVAAFNALSYGERKFLTGGNFRRGRWISHGAPSKPYYVAMQLLIAEAVEQCNRPDAKVHFIMDRQETLQANAVATFHDIAQVGVTVNGRTATLGMIAFESRLNEPGLQLADLFVHANYSHFVRGIDGLSVERDHALDRLTDKRAGTRYFDAEALERVLAKIPERERTWLRNQPK